MGTFGLNVSLKYVFKKIYDFLGTDYIPYIGQGSRPQGAHSCKSFISVPLLPATSFGMPSGHSQLAWFFAIYGCFILCSNPLSYFSNNTMNQTLKIISCIGLIIIATIISYSRVFIEECHTLGQVIIGGLIGIGSAIVAYIIKYAIMLIL
jgi:membrane-associated phospholipid phosphatase